MAKRFIKSSETSVPVSRSQVELERILRRYGCTGFGTSSDYNAGTASVTFRVPDGPDKNAPQIPIRLVIDTRAVYDGLYGRPTKWAPNGRVHDPTAYRQKELEQAERVAWRQVVLWVDAACSAATVGVQRMSEAFLAHTLIRSSDGRVMRVVDQMDAASGGSWLALLPAPKEVGT